MAKKVLSIVIGTECTKVCEVSYNKVNKNKGIRVFRSISFPTPPNTIEDGYIKNIEVFGEELRNQLKAGNLKSDKVIFSIASSKIANREIILPPTKEKKIMDIIMTGASDYFPIDIKDYILSYLILEKNTSTRRNKALQKKQEKLEKKLAKKQERLNNKALKKKSKTEIIAEKMDLMDATTSNQNVSSSESNDNKSAKTMKKQMRLSVYAVPSSLVKNYYTFAKAMHLDIVSLDYSGNSSYQILKRQAARGTNVFVQLNEQDTLISILRDDVLILQRTVGYGTSMLTDALMEQDYYQVNDSVKALELLESRNLFSASAEQDKSRVEGPLTASLEEAAITDEIFRRNLGGEEEARRNIIDSLHYLTNSIARMLDYYKTNNKNVEINSIYLSGPGGRIQGIDQFFYSEIGINNKKLEKLLSVSSNKKASRYRKNPGEFISCIGAVINPVDFVPKEFVEKKQKRSAIIATVVFALACLAGSVGTVYVSYTDYLIAKEELETEKEKLAALPEVSQVYNDNSVAKAELESLQQFEATTETKNDLITTIIKDLEGRLPTGTKINTMQFTETGVTMTATASGNKNALIAKMYLQLETIEYFDTVNIEGISDSEDEVISEVNFTISCSYRKE